ncbi:MAG: hypothetical protein DRJ67_05520 [Thermoprotei archaeon]|nr:MAG: hypothetical protein DRJ67_05520 [Thermoprotei archaeon]
MVELRVTEFHGGLRKVLYYYVVEGGELVHLSKYSRSWRREAGGIVEYLVDLERIRGREILCVGGSRRGGLVLGLISAEELASRPRALRPVTLSEVFRRFKVEVHSTLSNYVEDWRRYFIPMLEEIRELEGRLGRVKCSDLVRLHVDEVPELPASVLIPNPRAARRSVEALMAGIHEIWTALKILESVSVFTPVKESLFAPAGKCLNFSYANTRAVCTLTTRRGRKFSMWYQLDINVESLSYSGGWLYYARPPPAVKVWQERLREVVKRYGLRRQPTRPDMVLMEGEVTHFGDLSGDTVVAAVIDCKFHEFEEFRDEVFTQVIPYKEVFQAGHVILASLKDVPEEFKQSVKEVVVIDCVYPGGDGIGELTDLINEAL